MERKLNFTKKRLEAIDAPVEGKQVYYHDTVTRGLSLSVGRAGKKTFFLYRKIEGKPKRILIGPFPAIGVEQARKKAEEFNTEIAKGRRPDEQVKLSKAEITLEELFAEYLNGHIKKKRKGSFEIEKSFERNFHHWKHLKASSITRTDVEKLHESIAKSRGKYAANRAIELIRAIFNKAKIWKLHSGDNPASGISQFTEKKRDRILKADESARFFKALDEDPNTKFKDFVLLSLLTGQRKMNVLAMSWEQIDLEGGIWTISGEETKNEQTISIKLTNVEMEILKRRWKDRVGDFVFPGHGDRGHYVEPSKSWELLCRRAKIENLHLHDLRRSLASYMASSGAELALIKNALNHKDIKTTIEVYARTAKDAEMDARQKAHDMIFRYGNTDSKR